MDKTVYREVKMKASFLVEGKKEETWSLQVQLHSFPLETFSNQAICSRRQALIKIVLYVYGEINTFVGKAEERQKHAT